MQPAGVENESVVYSAQEPACYNSDLAGRYARWCNGGMSVTGVTNHILIGHKVCSTGGISCWAL